MLDCVDRIIIAVQDASATAGRWQQLLDGEIVRENEVTAFNSVRIVVQLGDSELEIHQPLGDGLIADHLRDGSGPFAVGFATPDLVALRSHLDSLEIGGLALDDDQLYLDAAALGIPGLRAVISPLQQLPATGLIDSLYECTHLTAAAARDTQRFALVFGLDQQQFVPINSEHYGYDGTLTLFDNTRLHRVETIHPYDETKTMGRYFSRFGTSLYMCYAQAADLAPIHARLQQYAPDDWTGSADDPDGLFIHPRATGSVMMGISRTTHAWSWSGFPERVVPAGYMGSG